MAISTSPKHEIAWAAGLFEGEGSLGYYSKKCSATLVTTDRDVLERFAAVVGLGKIEKSPRMPRPSNFAKKPQWVWKAVSFEDVQAIVAAFWPWLGERRRQRVAEVLREGALAPPESKYRSIAWRHNKCQEGHSIDGANKYTNPTSGRVFCIQCRDEYMRDYYRRKKAA
jgi:hypothetical protein